MGSLLQYRLHVDIRRRFRNLVLVRADVYNSSQGLLRGVLATFWFRWGLGDEV